VSEGVALKRIFLVISAAFAAALCSLPAQGATDRPPQFVVISFDNGSALERWQELSDFLGEINATGDRLHLTFFVSGTNFLPEGKRALYRGPGQPAGTSNIGFGGSPSDVARRIEFINRLHAEGNEIASHAVGHFDGKAWTSADWLAEFTAYKNLFTAAHEFKFSTNEIAGFRAPYLSRGPRMYAALQESGFRYDATGVGDADAWPEKKDGLWRFNLANLRIVGSGKYTLSMDYNFLIAQSGVAGNPRLQDTFREQMLRTYLDYFRRNYIGNRAPLHIGHHFSPMQGGVYDLALKTFARTICGLPEVRCVTYKKLVEFLDKANPETLHAYQRGEFPRAQEPLVDLAVTPLRGAL
jgi:hypothetical protein